MYIALLARRLVRGVILGSVILTLAGCPAPEDPAAAGGSGGGAGGAGGGGGTGGTADTLAPSAPTSLGATAASNSQINLTWAPSTDNVAVVGYQVERCAGSGCTNFAQIAAVGATTTYSDTTGLAANTSYRYRVRAADAVPNLSSYSNVAFATTLASASATYTISWIAVNDPNVTGYRIYYSTVAPMGAGAVGNLNVSGAGTTSVVFQPSANGITAGQTLYVAISSTGAGGLESPLSSPVSVVVQ